MHQKCRRHGRYISYDIKSGFEKMCGDNWGKKYEKIFTIPTGLNCIFELKKNKVDKEGLNRPVLIAGRLLYPVLPLLASNFDDWGSYRRHRLRVASAEQDIPLRMRINLSMVFLIKWLFKTLYCFCYLFINFCNCPKIMIFKF